MKKALFFLIGVSASVSMVAQSQQVCVPHKVNLTLEQTKRTDAESPSFYSQAHNSQRNGQNPSVQMTGTMFSSSYNANTLLVSQSNCMTANQALGIALFTHRMSQDWSVAGVNSGYIEASWTANNGASWDSMYWDNDGVKLFRYPSGAILNGTGNTTISNAWLGISGPYTPGSGWAGYYLEAAPIVSGFNNTGTGIPAASFNSFPRIDISAYSDSMIWVTGALLADDDVSGSAYRGATINRGVWDGTQVTWGIDSIKPNFHTDGAGATDTYQMTHLAFSANGQIGYAVFFGVQAAATTPETRTFNPIVYTTNDHGVTWSSTPWAPYDFTQIQIISDHIFPTAAGDLKPFFSMNNGSDCIVDNNNQLHVICCIESGFSDGEDSLGFTGAPQNWTTHYIFDVHTTGVNTWDAVLVDSIMTNATTTQSPFSDGTTPFDLDARLQASISPSRDHIFYFWADTDPSIAGGENAYPNLYGKGIDWSTNTQTARVQFTATDDAYYHYTSNLTLVTGSTYTIPTSNSIDRNGSHNTSTTFDHYYINDVQFDESDFTIPIGINEAVASFGTVGAYPNPATDVLNVNVTLNNSEMVMISMYNTIGQVALTETRNMSAGANTVTLNTANLEAGVYFMNVTAGGSTVTTKVVIQ